MFPYVAYYQAPMGVLKIEADDSAIKTIHHATSMEHLTDMPPEVIRTLIDELDAYFAGKNPRWTVPIAPEGTEFQQLVWAELQKIPYGETTTYGDIARTINKPTSFRAVGQANNRNPISVVIPCHRVIATDGAMQGYAGGLDRKEFLLALEQKDA